MKNEFKICGDIVHIFLKRRGLDDLVTTISVKDFDLVNNYQGTWYSRYDKNTNGYYVRGKIQGDNAKVIDLHRLILGTPKGFVIDHIDNNSLNNSRGNLRICENSENMRNRRKNSFGKSKYKGVTFDNTKVEKKWRTRISINGKRKEVGYYSTEEEAALAYNKAALNYHGSFANLNKIN